MRLPPLPTLKDIIRLHRLSAKKQLSQNFLLDMNVTRKIVRCTGPMSDCSVLEVGPGPGGITRSLFEAGAKHVSVVEKDSRFLPGLQFLKDAVDGQLDIYHDDILRFDTRNLTHCQPYAREWKQDCPSFHIIGNLPFNVSTPLIIQWLKDISKHRGLWHYGRAPLLSADRCRLSVICQYLCDVKLAFTIPGKSFVPSPKVDVGIVRFEPLKQPLIEDVKFEVVSKVLMNMFHFRQKEVKRGLRVLFPPDRPELVIEMIRKANINPAARCTMLSMEEINGVCQAYRDIISREEHLFLYDSRQSKNATEWKKASSHMFI